MEHSLTSLQLCCLQIRNQPSHLGGRKLQHDPKPGTETADTEDRQHSETITQVLTGHNDSSLVPIKAIQLLNPVLKQMWDKGPKDMTNPKWWDTLMIEVCTNLGVRVKWGKVSLRIKSRGIGDGLETTRFSNPWGKAVSMIKTNLICNRETAWNYNNSPDPILMIEWTGALAQAQTSLLISDEIPKVSVGLLVEVTLAPNMEHSHSHPMGTQSQPATQFKLTIRSQSITYISLSNLRERALTYRRS